MTVIPTEAEESCHFLMLLKFRDMRSLGNCAMRRAWMPKCHVTQGGARVAIALAPLTSRDGGNATGAKRRKDLMAPSASMIQWQMNLSRSSSRNCILAL